jgi:DNA-binding MarR family transcriptional regulator
VARRFDTALRPLGLTNGQFSLTANLKPLERRGLVTVSIDDTDKRSRHLTRTPTGRALLVAALPAWEDEHAAIEGLLTEFEPDRLRADCARSTDRRSARRLGRTPPGGNPALYAVIGHSLGAGRPGSSDWLSAVFLR